METILAYVTRRLRESGAARWEAIAVAAGAAKSLPRKLVYADRDNPGVNTVQPLLTFFQDVDAGRRELPEPPAATEGAPPVPASAAQEAV